MKILHLCLGAFFVDGYSYQENILAKYHVLQGHNVTVITSLFTYDNNGKGVYLQSSSKYKDKNGYDIIRLSFKKPVGWNRFFRHFDGLYKNIEEFNPDIIFSHNLSYGDTTVVRSYLKKHLGVKLFADNHADFINSAKNWWSKHILHPIIWRYKAKVLEPYMVKCYGVTPMRCRFLKQMYHINPNIVEYLPMGVDDSIIPLNREEVRKTVRQSLGVKDDVFLVFTGGKIDKLKNTHVLISSIERLNSPRVQLVICGVLTPQMESLKEKIKADSKIHYLGWCNAEQVMNCMVASDLACFPGTHSTLWEQSVGVGLPAIFKLWPEMEHVNVDGNCEFVFGDDIEELAKKISDLVFTEKYTKMLHNAELASTHFLYSYIAKKSIEY